MACMTRAVRVANSKCFRRLFCLPFAAIALLHPALAAGIDAPWPKIQLPKQVDTFDIGKELVVNGTPSRITGFVSHVPPTVLASAFKQMLGHPLMEDHHGTSLILGRGEGQFYITVQLDPSGPGTRGVIAVTAPPANLETGGDASAARRLLATLPPGSKLTSHTWFVDAGVRAEQDAVLNSHSIGVNSEYIQRMLRADGFILEREAGPSRSSHLPRNVSADSRTFFFKRPGAEAIAVLFTNDSGKSVVVLNRLHFQRRTE
jgi:hypothetical protein